MHKNTKINDDSLYMYCMHKCIKSICMHPSGRQGLNLSPDIVCHDTLVMCLDSTKGTAEKSAISKELFLKMRS